MNCPHCATKNPPVISELRKRHPRMRTPNQWACDTCGACYREEDDGRMTPVDPEVEDDNWFQESLIGSLLPKSKT